MIAALLLAAAVVAAPPTITVRGQARLEIAHQERVAGGVLVTVRLTDADLGEGMVERSVTLRVRRGEDELFSGTKTTNAQGEAQFLVPHRRGEYELQLSWPGDPLFVRMAPVKTQVDLSKEAVNLAMVAPARIDVEGKPFVVAVSARQQAGLPGLAVKLRLERVGAPDRTFRSVTDPEGVASFELDPRQLGPPGDGVLTASVAGSDAHNPAEAVARLTLFSRVKVSLGLGDREVRRDGQVTASGTVKDAAGPVAGGLVHLYSGPTRLGGARTDRQGRFRAALSVAGLPLGRRTVVASFMPDSAWRLAAESPPVTLTVVPRQPIRLAFFLAPAVLTTLVLLGVLLWRRRPWAVLRARWEQRRATAAQASGVTLAGRTSWRSMLAVDDREISGSVVQLPEGHPLVGATVHLRPLSGSTERQVATDGDGGFVLPGVADGTYLLIAAAPGFVPVSLRVTAPHRGELRGLVIRLLSVRRRVMQVYLDVIRPLLPDAGLARTWTPFEATRHVLRKQPNPPEGLVPLTELAAHVYYAETPPTPEVIDEAERLARPAPPRDGPP